MTKDGPRQADEDGTFRRQASKFRSSIPSAQFPAEGGQRYVLYINYGCPWAHRANIVRTLKGLEDIIQLVDVDDMDQAAGKGWFFSGKNGGPDRDPYLRELYLKADPQYEGRVTVPTLWDKQQNTVVNNESSEIIRMFYTAFDALLPEHLRESSKGPAGLFPEQLRAEIEAMNPWVYDTVNNGVYKCGFATAQAAYDASIYPLFASLDRLERHLADPAHQPYLFGEHITEADIRLFPTIARFDTAYHTLFKCNLKMIRHDYPRIDRWMRTLYWDESERTGGGAFKKTTKIEQFKAGYSRVAGNGVVPAGPEPPILPL
ncbi:putative glutathione s-transferase protein [Neofusicoccum parvum UCRNP2]|uniref:Glutathione S-transferase n=2 Tax=Neofusicoccum parvum TaxID=310453 RepID=A0ACB5SCY0_9PEZI|nr:putative glutathione s-transferase protein [Neofusicoccum parvum UCRNP2]GME35372.1 Glutathione S-transferase [Neofusicoccum parvum]